MATTIGGEMTSRCSLRIATTPFTTTCLRPGPEISMECLATCHVHSEWSYDGNWTVDSLSEKFSLRGSRVLMMTEHDRGFTAAKLANYRDACARASSNKMLVVPGIEYSDPENRVHVLVWG